ncbi:MAG TPA: glycerophosphodiester phosphodiesterase [Candidatus Limnocylindrales bacterium]|nr:glycerophosphodiester phosphodiesterase [Candidatus Limnocylindrales bacterium]
MNIIGHRGAAGLALENTAESIAAAIDAGVDAIEFDIRLTKDSKLVLSHDKHLGRVSEKSSLITENSLAKLKQIRLNNGEEIVTLAEAIVKAQNVPVIIEAKQNGWAKPLATFLGQLEDVSKLKVISFSHRELYSFHLLMPDIRVYALEDTKPFDVIHTARVLGLTGVDLNFWLLNPITYFLARYHRLDIMVYTVNTPWIARFLRLLYPRISITTDVPDQLQFLRKTKRRGKRASRRA